MAEYIFRCPHQAAVVTAPMAEGPGTPPYCNICDRPIPRAYKLEGVGFAIAKLTRERTEGTDRDLSRVFLETAEEAANPDDPDGSKAIREWNETHEPKDVGESKAIRPELPLHSKKVF